MTPLEVADGVWFFARDKQKHGPFSWEQFRDLAGAGELRPEDMVLKQGNARWLAARDVGGLFPASETVDDTDSVSFSAGDVPPSLEPATLPSSPDATGPWVRLDDPANPPTIAASVLPRVPGYELLGELGKGGMGIVYKARQAGLNRLVALKMIRTGANAGHDELERFRAEAQAVARLQHPNIVQIFEIGEWAPSDGQESMPYFSLEFVSGGSLAEKLAGQPQPPRQAAEMVETLAKAMHHAHAHGIIHRDLKPANVLLASGVSNDPGSETAGSLLTPLAVPKITDFGLAKELDVDSARTRAGAILGSPSYMSSEQAAGDVAHVGPLTDVYALGAILYEMLTGRPPFRGTTVYETLEHVRTREPVPPAQLQPGVPRDLETICLKCLQKDPQKRYSSAQALAEDVRSFLDGKPIRARPVGRIERLVRMCRRNPLVASLLALVVVVALSGAGLVIWQWREAVKNAETADRNAQDATRNGQDANRVAADFLLQNAAATGEPDSGFMDEAGDKSLFLIVRAMEKAIQAEDAELEESLRRQLAAWMYSVHRLHGPIPVERVTGMALSPDGKLVWFTSYPTLNDKGRGVTIRDPSRLSCWDLDSLNRLYEIEGGSEPLSEPAISPDGRWGLMLKGLSVSVWETSTGEEYTHLEHGPASTSAACFKPNNRHVLTGDSRGQIRLWSIAAGIPVASASTGDGAVERVVVSPDGKLAATATKTPKRNVVDVRLWSLPDLKTIGEPMTSVPSPAVLQFDASSRFLYVASSDGKLSSLAASTGARTDLSLVLGGHLTCVGVNQREERFVMGGGTLKIFERDHDRREGWAWRQFPNPPRTSAVAFSPDDSFWFAAGGTMFHDRGEVRLHSLPSNGQLGPPLRRTGRIMDARMTSDAKYLVAWDQLGSSFASFTSASVWELHRESTFGSSHASAESNGVTLSGSGRLAFCRSEGVLEIWNTQTGKPLGKPIAIPPSTYEIYVSDDDKTIVAWGDPSGTILKLDALDQPPRLFTTKLPSKEERPIASSGQADLSSNGRKLAAGNPRDQIHVWDLSTSKPGEVLLPTTLDALEKLKLSPSGRFLLVGGAKSSSSRMYEHFVEFWDVERAKMVAPPGKISNYLSYARFTADERRVWLGMLDGQIQEWDVQSGKRLGRTIGQSGSVLSLSLSQDEKVLLVGNADQTARLWNLEQEQPIGPAIKQLKPVTNTLLTPDGKLAVVAAQNLTVRLWDVRAGRALGPSVRTPGRVVDLGLTPEGDQLLIGCYGGKVVKYPLPVPETGTIAELTRRIERLTGTTLDKHGVLRVLSSEEWSQRARVEKP